MCVLAGLVVTSCEDVLEPDNDNHSTVKRLFSDPAFAEGLMLNGYIGLPNNYSLDEVATDDAVTNVKGSPYLNMATGQWSALYDPQSVWNSAYQKIFYLNYFLGVVNDVDYTWDNRVSSEVRRDSLFKIRFTGEAKALRAWYNFELLKRHGGIAADGNPAGFIILDQPADRITDSNLPRNTYDDCVQFIMDDIDEAISLLPNVYEDIPGDVAYNAVFGNVNNKNKNRINGRFAKALKSRVSLYIAGMPFYNKTGKWENAAVAAAALLTINGGGINGIAGMSNSGLNFWKSENDPEILFRGDYANSNAREKVNFPPSRYGNGATNPSQNLVDAFPMANGYPTGHSLSSYDASDPYNGRDPRLKAYIVYNGNDINGVPVNTTIESPKDGLNLLVTSTRTGYYLKKLLHPAVNLTPGVVSTQRQFYAFFRYTEIFLNYAEAANEAWGPDADPKGYGFTPRSIIAAIRKRGGIPVADPYLHSVTDQGGMRQLIRNERRIELCFEGFRFWDMRRWGLPLDEIVKGMSIADGVHTVIDVESRIFQPYMKYGPIPFQEILKADRILQNQGW